YAEVLQPLGFTAEDLPTASVPPRQGKEQLAKWMRVGEMACRARSSWPSGCEWGRWRAGQGAAGQVDASGGDGVQGKEQLAKWVQVAAPSKV
ncbi:unnamed protein product, partial [Closterium sp. NIES-53]